MARPLDSPGPSAAAAAAAAELHGDGEVDGTDGGAKDPRRPLWPTHRGEANELERSRALSALAQASASSATPEGLIGLSAEEEAILIALRRESLG